MIMSYPKETSLSTNSSKNIYNSKTDIRKERVSMRAKGIKKWLEPFGLETKPDLKALTRFPR